MSTVRVLGVPHTEIESQYGGERREDTEILVSDAFQIDQPRRPPVYVCNDCDASSLGEHYRVDCRTFMRAVGIGGLCPNCRSPSPRSSKGWLMA